MSERGALVLWMPLAARVQAVARRTKTAPAGSAAGSSLTRSGRVTPKGGQARKAAPRSVQAAAGRYTEPIPRAYRTSPRWYPYFVLGLFVIGVAVILLNYLSLVPGFGGASNIYLFVGLALIVAGFVAATRWH
jgi:hypothetical protein